MYMHMFIGVYAYTCRYTYMYMFTYMYRYVTVYRHICVYKYQSASKVAVLGFLLNSIIWGPLVKLRVLGTSLIP